MKSPKNFKVSPLFLSITSFFPIYVDAQVIVDNKGAGNTSITTAANGVPVIDINNPDNYGVSHNKYTDFNVGKEGIIFNNSTKEGVSQIGGFVINNPNINREASAIINEVTGVKGTQLNGTMEIFGRKADLIIANENGISVNGLATLNTNNLTLSTGSLHRGSDGSILLSVERGNISIEGLGVNTAGVSYFDLISRTALLTGEINGQANLKIVTGKNDYNIEKREHSVREQTAEDSPAVAISASQLGSMYGNRIQLISTESGAGVHHEGSIIGGKGIEITANGDIHLTSLATDEGSLHVSGNSISLTNNDTAKLGGISAQNDIILKALSTIDLRSDIVSHQGMITINANDLLQTSAKLLANKGLTKSNDIPGIKINVGNKYLLTGDLYAVDSSGKKLNEAKITLENGNYIVSVNNVKITDALVYSDASISTLHSNIEVTANHFDNQSGVISTRNGTLELTINETLLNNGIVQAKGSLILHGKKFKNNGVINTTDRLLFKLGSLDNNGSLFANNIDITTNNLKNSGVLLSENGDISIDVSGSETFENSGLLKGSNVNLAISGELINSGNINSNKNLSVKSKALKNTNKIISDNAIDITIDNGLVNSGEDAFISSGKSLSIVKSNNDKTASLFNASQAVLQSGGVISINNINSITNEGLIAAQDKLAMSNGEELSNDKGRLQGSTINISNYDVFSNKDNAKVLAANDIKVNDVDVVINDKSTIAAYNNIFIANLLEFKNSLSELSATYQLNLNNIDKLDNKLSSVSSTSGDIFLNSIHEINNTVGSVLSAANNVIIIDSGEIRNSENSFIQANNNIEISNVNNLKNYGNLLAQAGMIVRDITSLINSGDTAIIQATNILLEKIKIITNKNTASILADNTLIVEKSETFLNDLSALIQASKANISVEVLKNQGYQSYIISDSDLNITADSVSNENEAGIFSNNLLHIEAADVINGDNSDINSYQFSIVSDNLVNKGTISSQNSMSGDVITTSSFDNKSGRVLSDGSLTINTGDYIANDASGIFSAKLLSLNLVKDFNNDLAGRLTTNGMLSISTLGDININKVIESHGGVTLSSSVINNNAAIVSMNNIYLNAASIINDINSLLFSMKDIYIKAKNDVTNNAGANILSQGNLNIKSDVVKNLAGTIRSESDVIFDVNQLDNISSYKNENWDTGSLEQGRGSWVYSEPFYTEKVYATVNLPMLVSDISLDKKAEISAGGSLYFNSFRTDESLGLLNNRGGIIQAKKNINILGNVTNTSGYLSTNYYDILKLSSGKNIQLSFEHYQPLYNNLGTLSFSNMFEVLRYIYGRDGSHSATGGTISFSGSYGKFHNALVDLSARHSRLNNVMKSIFGEYWRTDKFDSLVAKWKDLSTNSFQNLKDKKYYFLPADKGEISAGGHVVILGGKLNNGIDAQLGSDIKQLNNMINVEVGDKSVSTLEQGYEVAFSTKKLEEIKQGVSVLPALEDLINIKGLFQQSQAFLNLEDLTINTANRKDSIIVPMYETRIEMIDMSNYYGSDYFFNKVGYHPDKPVIVIGDDYFINELLRRQINNTLGAELSKKFGVEGADLIKTLFDNTGVLIKSGNSGFEVGRALTADQIDNLTQDVVWFVTESIDGIDVLVPKIYLAKATIDSLSDNNSSGAASIQAGGNISLEVEQFNNYNGSVSGSGDVNIQAKGDINNSSSGMSSGINAGGSVMMTSTEGNINNSGAYIKAEDTISLTADRGDVSLISSVGRDPKGDQVIGSYDDGVSAGKNINITANNIDVTAVELSTGDDPNSVISLTSTEGSVRFNDIHELNSTSEHSNTQIDFLSHRTIDEIDISAKSKASSVNTKGNLNINSSEDIVFTGGEYNAGSAIISADKNITVKTSQDHHIHEKTVTETDFVIDLNLDLPGMSKKGLTHSTLDGTTYTNSQDYQSGGSTAELNTASAKRPGAAPTADTASFKIGAQSTQSKTTESTTTNTNTQFNFENGTLIKAGETADIGGMDLTVSDAAAATIMAGDVQSTKYNDTYTKEDSYKETFVGIKSEAHSAIVDAANKYSNLGNKSENQDMEVDAWRTTAQVAGDVTNLVTNDLAGGSIKAGWSEVTTSESQSSSVENKNSITGGQINIISDKDIVLHGTDVNAAQVNMNAGGDLTLKAAEKMATSSSARATHDAGVSVSAGVSAMGAGVGVSVDYSGSVSSGSSESKSYDNSKINAQQVNVTTGNNVTLEGANISAVEANMEIGGDLTIQSKQDTTLVKGNSESWGVSAGASVSTSGILPNASGQYGGGSERHESALTKEQSGIVTSGSVDIHTQGNLTMAGGHIISGNGTGAVTVEGDVNTSVIKDYIDSEGMYQGGGGGLSYKGMPTGNYYNDTLDEVHIKADQNNTINVNTSVSGQVQGHINTDLDKAAVITEESKKAGNNISVTLTVPNLTSKKGSYDVNTDNIPSKSSNGTDQKKPSSSSSQNSNQGQGSKTSDALQSSTQHTPAQTSTTYSNVEYSSISHGAKPSQKPSTSTSSIQHGSVTTPTKNDNSHTISQNGTSQPIQGSSTPSKGKWPTVNPGTGYIGGTGSASRPDGMNSGKSTSTSHTSYSSNISANPSSAVNNSAKKPSSTQNRPNGADNAVVTQGNNSKPTQGSTSTDKGKWPTVNPSTGFIGGTGSASRLDGMNSGKSSPNRQNVNTSNVSGSHTLFSSGNSSAKQPSSTQNRPTGADNAVVAQGTNSKPTQGSTSTDKGNWPTVNPSTGFIGGTGSASRLDGMNSAGTKIAAPHNPSSNSSVKKGNITDSVTSENTTLQYRAISSKQKLPSQTYDGKNWPSVTESNKLIGGTGSSSRLDGMNSSRIETGDKNRN